MFIHITLKTDSFLKSFCDKDPRLRTQTHPPDYNLIHLSFSFFISLLSF
jgi:hypothetical protein